VILQTWIVIVIKCGNRKAVKTTKLKLEALVRNQGGHRQKGTWSQSDWVTVGWDGGRMGHDWDGMEVLEVVDIRKRRKQVFQIPR
jgi:hypothetical protein